MNLVVPKRKKVVLVVKKIKKKLEIGIMNVLMG